MDKLDVYCQSVTGRHVSLVQKDVGSNRLRYTWKLDLGQLIRRQLIWQQQRGP